MGDGSPVAPSRIVQCLPLTYVAHCVVTACNDIRRCAALAAKNRCYSILKTALLRIVDQVRAAADDPGTLQHDRDQAEAILSIAADDLLPFVCRCVDFVFDTTEAEDMLLLDALHRLRDD